MRKFLQSMMYLISLGAVVAVIVALVMAGKKEPQNELQADTKQEWNEETEAETEAEVETETEAETEMEAEKETTQPTEVTESNAAIKQEDGKETTIIFTGDVLFANAFKAGYDAKGISGVISEPLLDELLRADVLMVNQEFPFGESEVPVADKQYTFQCNPSYVTALQEMGVDAVSLANNHVLDYGKEALRQTFVTLEHAGIRYCGAGESVERAKQVQMIEVNGKTYGFLAVSRVVPSGDWKVENSAPGVFSCYDDAGLVELVTQASKECDFLAVYPHWGVEYEAYPQDYQTKIAEHCLAAGADIVVGSHTHCLQGAAMMDGKPVCYSLGNFVFGQTIEQSAMVKVTIAADGTVSACYVPVYAAGGVTYLAEGEKATEILTYLNHISEATVATDGMIME